MALTATELAASAGAPVVPVIVIDDAEHAVALGESLVAGGIRTAEVTFRTPAGLEAIRRMAQVGGLIVGAGTVIDPEGVERAVDAGARFIVSPGLDEAVVNRCRDLDVLALPGVATASEVQHAMRLGLQAVKLFPAGV
ncbi:MAG: keto-deoxy-phosphogluconate aldolase, partial [Microbacteriaceae bacterium]|nr:keto-deoxy-phosphogluconate aldolase [Microbacteriaceae bacterium]